MGTWRAGGPAAYCGNMGQGVQLLTVSTYGQGFSCLKLVLVRQGVQLLTASGPAACNIQLLNSGYIGAWV